MLVEIILFTPVLAKVYAGIFKRAKCIMRYDNSKWVGEVVLAVAESTARFAERLLWSH